MVLLVTADYYLLLGGYLGGIVWGTGGYCRVLGGNAGYWGVLEVLWSKRRYWGILEYCGVLRGTVGNCLGSEG